MGEAAGEAMRKPGVVQASGPCARGRELRRAMRRPREAGVRPGGVGVVRAGGPTNSARPSWCLAAATLACQVTLLDGCPWW
jgi:hypothetical protein